MRFGGLIGPERHPVFQLSNKEFTNGEELVNLIHQNDAIHLIVTIIKQGYWNEIFNGVYPYHPKKSVYYTSEAKLKGIPPPIYTPSLKHRLQKRIILEIFMLKGTISPHQFLLNSPQNPLCSQQSRHYTVNYNTD